MIALLMLSADVIKDIDKVRTHAEAHPLTEDQMRAAVKSGDSPIQDNPAHWCLVPLGFRAAFSIEPAISKTTNEKIGTLRHLSISTDSGKPPAPQAVDLLMQAFGFTCHLGAALGEGFVWMEDGDRAVNVVQFLEAPEGQAAPEGLPE